MTLRYMCRCTIIRVIAMHWMLKIILVILVVSLGGVCLADDIVLPKKQMVKAGFFLPAVSTLSVELRKISDDNLVPVSHMTFTGLKSEEFGVDNPWVIADQYVRIIYDCNTPNWGIRLVTDNKIIWNKMYPKPLAQGEDGQWEWEEAGNDGYVYVNGQYQVGDDIVSYGGLVSADKYDDPRLRAELAWQIYENKQFPDILSDAEVDPTPEDPADNWKTKWAYMMDKSDSGYAGGLVLDYFWGEDNEVLAEYNYNLAIFGNGAASYLAQHPITGMGMDGVPFPKAGDGDVVVYIGARFGSKDYTGEDPLEFELPAGGYGATVYVELLHE